MGAVLESGHPVDASAPSPTLVIRLLGRPEIVRDGGVVPPPRGHKAWAVLAYLALAERRVPRARLAGLIFGGAEDPLGALRWTLAQLRRALGVGDALQGDPLELRLPPGTAVDVLTLAGGAPDPALVRGELLEGVEPGAGEVFESWLLVERRRTAGLCEAVLRDAALRALAAGAPLEGAALASRALALDAFDESAHELLVRCLARAGEHRAAHRHAEACDELFRRELGHPAGARVRRAAEEHGPRDAPPGGDRAAALGQLDAGRAAVDAGAVEPGVACLRQAWRRRRGVGDPVLLARALAALGVALVHAVRGPRRAGRTRCCTRRSRSPARASAGSPEDLPRARLRRGAGGPRVSAERWLVRADRLADDEQERAAVLAVRGMARSDRAQYAARWRSCASRCHRPRCGDSRQAAWSLGLLGRAHLLRAEVPRRSRRSTRRSQLWSASAGWRTSRARRRCARRPRSAPPTRARGGAARPCVRARLPPARPHAGRRWPPARAALHESAASAARRSRACATPRSVPYASPTVRLDPAHCLDALAALAIADGAPDAPSHVETLERLAAHGDMRGARRAGRAAPRAPRRRRRRRDGAPGRRVRRQPALHAELAAAPLARTLTQPHGLASSELWSRRPSGRTPLLARRSRGCARPRPGLAKVGPVTTPEATARRPALLVVDDEPPVLRAVRVTCAAASARPTACCEPGRAPRRRTRCASCASAASRSRSCSPTSGCPA
jgi:DNA-binding SARP family transcriptional activator